MNSLLRLIPICTLTWVTAVHANATKAVANDSIVDVVATPVPYAASRQALTFELGAGPRTLGVIPINPPPASIVPPGSKVTLRLSSDFGNVTNIKWFHNGQLLATAAEFIIESVSLDDAGSYGATFDGNAVFASTDPLQLELGTNDRERMANLSVRAKLSPSSPSATFGFVISPRKAWRLFGTDSRVLIRAIGPTLADFDISPALPDPVYTLRNSSGTDITPGMVFTTEIVDGKTAEQRYREEVDQLSAAVGAFPATTDLQSADAPRNLGDIAYLSAGAYTFTVSSASGATGEVLVEIYDAWQDPALGSTR